MKKVYRSGKAVDIKTTSSKDKSLVVQVNKEIIHFQEIAEKARAQVDELIDENLWNYVGKEVDRIKQDNSHRSKKEFLEMYATTKLLLDAYLRDLEVQGVKIDVLIKNYCENVEGRQEAGKKRGVRRHPLYVRRGELAEATVKAMESRYGKLQSSHSKEFYRLLVEACESESLPETPHETARNYFKKFTGLDSTR